MIVAAPVTQEANGKEQLVPMLGLVKRNLERVPSVILGDAGYFSARAVGDEADPAGVRASEMRPRARQTPYWA